MWKKRAHSRSSEHGPFLFCDRMFELYFPWNERNQNLLGPRVLETCFESVRMGAIMTSGRLDYGEDSLRTAPMMKDCHYDGGCREGGG